uniref:MYND-type domain-containing protein n=1 Tax=Oryza barthii TaxID=65489 RepID=A0A0D3EMY2_9ORYZ
MCPSSLPAGVRLYLPPCHVRVHARRVHATAAGYGGEARCHQEHLRRAAEDADDAFHLAHVGFIVSRHAILSAKGRHFIVVASAWELTLALAAAASWRPFASLHLTRGGAIGGCLLLSDFRWSLPEAEPYLANLFMADSSMSCGVQATAKKLDLEAPVAATAATSDKNGHSELQLCSQVRCGRRETRRHEFRRCSVCGAANYCSRCWTGMHKAQCMPMDLWLLVDGEA